MVWETVIKSSVFMSNDNVREHNYIYSFSHWVTIMYKITLLGKDSKYMVMVIFWFISMSESSLIPVNRYITMNEPLKLLKS